MSEREGAGRERSIRENMAEIQANIESIERTWWRWGLPSVIAASFLLGVLAGLGLCSVIHT